MPMELRNLFLNKFLCAKNEKQIARSITDRSAQNSLDCISCGLKFSNFSEEGQPTNEISLLQSSSLWIKARSVSVDIEH